MGKEADRNNDPIWMMVFPGIIAIGRKAKSIKIGRNDASSVVFHNFTAYFSICGTIIASDRNGSTRYEKIIRAALTDTMTNVAINGIS